ncbi:hypothetical protein T4B_530 [Trichinella pseudospiralis]|uniref:Uncharacterized protein n=1 Tax=Trichinella pseudospiralis TaxID=6337 RepID=A0A0V1KC22_TRIPS|nr:hypothetical protein T4B_530 [Trichinella pseudospiralis]KRZ44732.1 hypothetical protein T4C_3674 [Trichinella pseudospiralis]
MWLIITIMLQKVPVLGMTRVGKCIIIFNNGFMTTEPILILLITNRSEVIFSIISNSNSSSGSSSGICKCFKNTRPSYWLTKLPMNVKRGCGRGKLFALVEFKF